MKLGFVEIGRMALDLAGRLAAQEHHLVGYGPNSEPVPFFPETGGRASPHHGSSNALLQDDAVRDARGWMDVWLVAAV